MSICQITEDAVTLRGIVALLGEAPATTHEIQMTQHVGHGTAKRLCAMLQKAGIIERPTATRIVLGVPQQVPLLEWRLTTAYRRGERQLEAERLARGQA